MPLNDPLVKDTKFNADYRVNRALKADGKTVFHTRYKQRFNKP